MDRQRSRKPGLDRESMEPLSASDHIRDSAIDRHTFESRSPSFHRPTPIPQSGTPGRTEYGVTSSSPHLRTAHEFDEGEAAVLHDHAGEDPHSQLPLSRSLHDLPSYGLHTNGSNNMDEALLGPGSIGKGSTYRQQPAQPAPEPPHHRRFGSGSRQGSMDPTPPHHRRYGSHEGPSPQLTPRHQRRPSGSHQDMNGDVDSANGSPPHENGGETSLASHDHVGNREAKEIAVVPLHAKDDDLMAVVRFLRTTPGLSYAVIGELLGDSSDRCVHVLEEFTRSFNFSGLPFETALRGYLEAFRLPGESQKIYRILQAFSEHYWKQCGRTSPFRSEDAVLTLSFSAVILNTDIHNPAVKQKMTEQQYVHNNRGINDGQDFAPGLLGELYQNIKQQGLRVPASAHLPSQHDSFSASVEGSKSTRVQRRCCCMSF